MCSLLHRFYWEDLNAVQKRFVNHCWTAWLSPPISCSAHDTQFTKERRWQSKTGPTIAVSKQWFTRKVAGRGRKADGKANYAVRPRVKVHKETAIISKGHQTSHGRWILSSSAHPERDTEVVEMIMSDLMVWTHAGNYRVCCACNRKIIGCLAENGATVTYFLCWCWTKAKISTQLTCGCFCRCVSTVACGGRRKLM